MSEDEDSVPTGAKNFDTSASTPNLLPHKSPHNKRRGLSETPEIQRKSRKLFAARTRDVDKVSGDTEKVLRKRSLTGGRSSIDETESSRKSSVSSGHRKRQQKQFAVTLLVNENDKNKIMDMLQKAKSVISKKVEKVMGKKPQKSDISNADALKTVLQNWVDEAETEEKQEEFAEDELIQAQESQVASLRSRGYDPPVHLRPMPTTTVGMVGGERVTCAGTGAYCGNVLGRWRWLWQGCGHGWPWRCDLVLRCWCRLHVGVVWFRRRRCIGA